MKNFFACATLFSGQLETQIITNRFGVIVDIHEIDDGHGWIPQLSSTKTQESRASLVAMVESTELGVNGYLPALQAKRWKISVENV